MDRNQQNLALLRQAALYGLVLNEIAREEIYQGKQFDGVFKSEPWGNYFDWHHKKNGRALGGLVSYATPTPAGLALVGSNKDRANNSNAAISQRLPVYWLCHAGPSRRYLVPQADAEKFLGEIPNNVSFVIGREGKEFV